MLKWFRNLGIAVVIGLMLGPIVWIINWPLELCGIVLLMFFVIGVLVLNAFLATWAYFNLVDLHPDYADKDEKMGLREKLYLLSGANLLLLIYILFTPDIISFFWIGYHAFFCLVLFFFSNALSWTECKSEETNDLKELM